MWVLSLGQKDLLEKEMATHSSIFAWEIPWTEELDGLQYIDSQKGWHYWRPKQLNYANFLLYNYSVLEDFMVLEIYPFFVFQVVYFVGIHFYSILLWAFLLL